MPYPAKLMNLSALLLKAEATYGTAIAVTATADGQLLALSDRFPGLLTLGYAWDGDIGPAPGHLGMLQRQGALGRTVSGTIPMRAKGSGVGTTYAATVLPNIHTMLKISGFDATLAANAYTYTPTADGVTYASATAEMYKRGEKWSGRGILANWSVAGSGAAPPIHSFDIKGICDTTITDSAMVAPTYPSLTSLEPPCAGISVTVGSWITPVIRSWSFAMNRAIDATRLDLTAADVHQGFVPAGYAPELKLVVESTALTYPTSSSGFDPYRLRSGADATALSLQVGTVASNKYKIVLPQSQLVDSQPNNDGPVATVELTFRGYNSSPIVQTDAVQVIFA